MKNKIIVFIFLIYIFSFSILHIVFKDEDISKTERRKLAEFPSFQSTSEYITKVDKYLLDHFPYRDEFRSIKANFNYKVLNKLDNNDIYLKDNNIFKSNYPTDKKSVENFVNKTEEIKSMLSENNKVYMMIIPDKNLYLQDKNFLQIDYDYIYNEINKLGIPNIDIRNIMNLEDYYQTDTHWKQENLNKVVSKMGTEIGFDYKEDNYEKNKYDNFYGVYYGEAAINREPEELIYLSNEILNSVAVSYLENEELKSIYSLEKLNSLDPYEVYLDGASAFIEINNNANTNKELVIFRDSYASSIAPLLVNYYSKITLIDNRYINSKNFLELINFENQDVIFMYSTLIINNSYSLKG